jgi:hypothetical protein
MKTRFLLTISCVALTMLATPSHACKVDREASVKDFVKRDRNNDLHLDIQEYYGGTPLKFIPQIKREEHMKELDKNGDGVDMEEFLKEKSEQKC